MGKGKRHRDARYVRELAQQDQDVAAARELGADLLQPVDEASPLPCTRNGCEQPAVVVVRLSAGNPDERLMTACQEHRAAMMLAWHQR